MTFIFGTAHADRQFGIELIAAWTIMTVIYLIIARLWPSINRGAERAVRWFWAADTAPVVGISTRSVDEIVRDYEREPKAARTRLHYKRKNVR